MPTYMDVHHMDGSVSAGDVAGAHQADLQTQAQYGVDYKACTSRGLERVYRDNDCLMSDDAEHARVLYKLDPFWNNGC